MSTIASLLSNLLTDYKKSSAAVDSSTAVSTIPNNDNSNSGNYGDACVLDLSQAAQDILSSKSSNSVISLTDTQKQKLKDILDKYKDAPVNNETLSTLYNDLRQAGLAPDELAAIQQAKDFNPVQVFMEILFGGTDNNNNSLNSDDILSGLGVQGSKSTTTLSELIDKYKAANTDIADNLTLDKSL